MSERRHCLVKFNSCELTDMRSICWWTETRKLYT